jgi:microcystin degradation protein MlrC
MTISKRPLRIAYARINQETHALSPIETTIADFERDHYLVGDALALACEKGQTEVKGFAKELELSGFMRAVEESGQTIEAVPLFSAWAIPNGPLTKECVFTLRDRLVDALRAAGPVDGVFLSLHGAMGSREVRDPETVFLRAVRDVVGDVPLATTYDLHGNLTKERIALTDVLVAYKTNPHRDHARIGKQAGRALIDHIVKKTKPTIGWRSLPMILGGGTTIDFLPTMRPVFARAKELEKDPRVIAASVFMCHPWNNDPGLGWSVAVVTDNDPVLADKLANELAEMCWSRKEKLPPTFYSPSAGIARAREMKFARKVGVITMSDASDVTSAGAPGASTKLVKALLDEGQGMRSYIAIRDPDAVEELFSQQTGDVVDVTIGGNIDPASPRLTLKGTLFSKSTQHGFERVAAVDMGHVVVCITEGPPLIMKPDFYKECGLSIWKADIVVVKNFFPFLLFYAPYNRYTIFVKTGGLTDFDSAHVLPFDGPIYPRDVVTDWHARDLERRGLATTDAKTRLAA